MTKQKAIHMIHVHYNKKEYGGNCPIKEDWMIKLSLSNMIPYVPLNIKQYYEYYLETWKNVL